MVRSLERAGHLIGSCSDRPVSFQAELWRRLGIVPHFTVLKHRLDDVRARFAATTYVHVGDTDIDHHYATLAGFEFIRADASLPAAWPRLLVAAP